MLKKDICHNCADYTECDPIPDNAGTPHSICRNPQCRETFEKELAVLRAARQVDAVGAVPPTSEKLKFKERLTAIWNGEKSDSIWGPGNEIMVRPGIA